MTEQELQALQQQYGAYCAAIVNRILTDPRDREECLNDLWLRVWKALEASHPDYLKGWLGIVARNCALDRARQLNALPLQVEDSAAELAQGIRDTVAEHMDSMTLGESLSTFLLTQPQDRRIAFVWRYWYGDTVREVALFMGWSTTKTTAVLFRLRSKLKEHLTKEGIYHGK